MTSKNGKKFAILKLTDLNKYDLDQVKKTLFSMLAAKLKAGTCEKDELELEMKAYGKNGYKQITIMCFGDSAQLVAKIRPGTVVQILNPKVLKSNGNKDQGIAFSIDSEM